MPEMNGVEVLKKIREKTPKTLIYIITAFHQEFLSELNEARNHGYDFELLSKPIDREQLRQIVDSLLNDNS
jgi:CheY-like chemotaxis protein